MKVSTPGSAASIETAPARPVEPVAPAPGTPLGAGLLTVYRAQLSRVRVSRVPLLFVAVFQSVGIMILMRGVVDTGSDSAREAVVAGSSVLVVAFVALNLLAQHFGNLRAANALDYYLTLPVRPAAVVLGIAAAYASFTLPGTVATAVIGALMFQLPLANLWVLLLVVPLSGAALAGIGAVFGLLAPRPELATLLGQLGMSAALLLGVLPEDRMPEVIVLGRDLLPSSYGVDAFIASYGDPNWAAVAGNLAVCAGVGVVMLSLATWAFRRSTRA
ncbi:transporter [Embleya scabrispora]|uniref:Transporter n=1 Tax=Embleya scabrispora TaxID=159449 RepID=A0A1T3P8N4_9ACTN|nr:ABC transporter permease [Embleya scabrispora]OPC85220.1 transporter [Embleya scabrispora]